MIPSDLTNLYNIHTGSWTIGDSWYPTYPATQTIWYSYPTTVYLYQVKCPAEDCGKTNWLELDKITDCTKCGAKLKAVSQKVDHEIQIEE